MIERKIKTVKDLQEILLPTNPDTTIMMPDDLSIMYYPEEDVLRIQKALSGNISLKFDGPLSEFMFTSAQTDSDLDGYPARYCYEDPGSAVIYVFGLPDTLIRPCAEGLYSIFKTEQWCHAGDDGASLDELITVYQMINSKGFRVAYSVVGNYEYYEDAITQMLKGSQQSTLVSHYASGTDALRELYARSLLPFDSEMDILWVDTNGTGTDSWPYTVYGAPLRVVNGISSTDGTLVVITRRGNIPVLIMATEMDAVMRDSDWAVIKCYAEMIHAAQGIRPHIITKRMAGTFSEALCEVPSVMEFAINASQQLDGERN